MHVSEIAHKYITDPSEVLKLGQKVQVKVLEVDMVRKRIALSIKQTEEMPQRPQRSGPRPSQDRPAQKPAEGLSVADALSLLKKKFGK